MLLRVHPTVDSNVARAYDETDIRALSTHPG
jgi:hypothetical protein